MHIARMHISEFMERNDLDDEAMAAKIRTKAVACDRTEVSKYRRRLIRPNWTKIARIREVSGGQVSADDWLQTEAAE